MQGELLAENMKQESHFQSEVTSEAFIGSNSQRSHVSNDYSNRNLAFANNSYRVPNYFTTDSTGNQIPYFPNIGGGGGDYSSTLGDATSGTGIIRRIRPIPDQTSAQNPASHGTAPRRIRLQKKLQIGPVECRLPNESPELTQVRSYFILT